MIKAKEFYALDKITYAYRQGHQQTKWSKEKQADLLKGLIYNSKLAKFNQLNDLSNKVLELHKKGIPLTAIIETLDTTLTGIKEETKNPTKALKR